MEIWAHRGRLFYGLLGNTLLDFQDAYDLGVHGIETDVCFTAPDEDGSQQTIIHHPDPKDHGDPRIKTLSLDSFLSFIKVHPNIYCFLDPKENSNELMDIVVKKITEYGLGERIYLTVCQPRISFLGLKVSAKLILRARTLNPKIKTHIIATLPFSLPALARRYNPDIISVGWLPESKFSIWFFKKFLMNVVDLKNQIRQVQDMGIEIIGGIANNKKDFEYLDNLGVNGIMTDNSVAAIEFFKIKSP